MKRNVLALCALFALIGGEVASQAPTQRPAPAGQQLDLGAARRQAADLAEVRAILNDPDANVRLLAIREIATRGNAVQRQIAIEAGLSSTDAVVQEMTLRMLVATFQTIVLPFIADEEGGLEKPFAARNGDTVALNLAIRSFDTETGRFAGNVPGGCNNQTFVGQLTGNLLTFSTEAGLCTGSLRWNPNRREFTGSVNLSYGRVEYGRRVLWRPM